MHPCYRPQRSCGKVIFSEVCLKNSVHGEGGCVCGRGGMYGWGVCMAGGIHGRGAYMAGGHAWQEACMAGGHT